MLESLGIQNLGLLLQNLSLFISSIAMAEAFDKLNIKGVLTLQRGIGRVQKNILELSKEIGNKGSSGVIINLGKKVFNFHHSRFGFLLMVLSVILANISLLFFSLGLVIHHVVREKKLF